MNVIRRLGSDHRVDPNCINEVLDGVAVACLCGSGRATPRCLLSCAVVCACPAHSPLRAHHGLHRVAARRRDGAGGILCSQGADPGREPHCGLCVGVSATPCMLRLLTMRGVRAQLYDARSMSALHMACEVDRSDAVRDLLALPTLNVNIVNVRDADETAVYTRCCN